MSPAQPPAYGHTTTRRGPGIAPAPMRALFRCCPRPRLKAMRRYAAIIALTPYALIAVPSLGAQQSSPPGVLGFYR
jgi:hypothetical protein